MAAPAPYRPKNHVRIITAASLFDGHDAAINIMRRILQASGAEVIHLGHNRSAQEIVDAAIQEDAQGIAVTSYQGGHVEFFKYMRDLLKEQNASVRIFGGGGGTILPSEADELHKYGIDRIYSPDDGRSLGLQGMINDLLEKCDFPTRAEIDADVAQLKTRNAGAIGRLISAAETHPEWEAEIKRRVAGATNGKKIPVLGVTGTGGSGKSSLVDEIVRRYLLDQPDKTLAVISVDPTKRKSGGALLGDRIRMNAIASDRVYMRSLATRQSNVALSKHVRDAVDVCKAAGFDLIILETSGIGQSDTEITDHADLSLYVMTSEYGAATQLEKIDMLDYADVVAINKFDKRGSLDALRDVRKQYKRNQQLFTAADDDLPIYGTIASQFNDAGTNALYKKLLEVLAKKTGVSFSLHTELAIDKSGQPSVIPADRVRYLAEIAEASDRYESFAKEQSRRARCAYQLFGAVAALRGTRVTEWDVLPDLEPLETDTSAVKELLERYKEEVERLDGDSRGCLRGWPEVRRRYKADVFRYQVRERVIEQPLFSESLSHTRIPKVALPRYTDWGDILFWILSENVPGEFPYAAGVFNLKREGEDPARMFAGEGGPERTNKRFHYVSRGLPAKRLSTAFDSVTLYGEDPARRPDIYGKVGNSGVSIA
ncbi:MAG: methylmalonyl-CoA mutase family protein, partial [Polyangiaceae bacterium]|nr:methylmalonyl-CoA mutase family protein [Polyangiaceae bacterium]